MIPKDSQVFIVDDDGDVREAIAALVTQLGLAATGFDSAEAFLSGYRGERPACVVTDVRMLGMTGLELQVELGRLGLHLPVIVLTAHADTPTTVRAMKQGAFTLLDKPCRDSELWEAIRTALEQDVEQVRLDARRQELQGHLALLTPGEQDVLDLLMEGEANKVIAQKLDLGLRTVEARRQSLLKKFEVDSLAELIPLVLLARQAAVRN